MQTINCDHSLSVDPRPQFEPKLLRVIQDSPPSCVRRSLVPHSPGAYSGIQNAHAAFTTLLPNMPIRSDV